MKAIKPSLNLIILGDPGAGKATHTKLLAEKYNFIDFDMGKELTKLRKKNAKADSVLKGKVDKGMLAPTQMVRDIILSTIKNTKLEKGIVFDGHPKMLGEAKLVAKLIKSTKRPEPLVIYLSIPQKEVVARVLAREGYFKGKFSKRVDDNEKALKNRAKYYRTNIKQVVDFFKANYKFKKLSSLGTIEEVQDKLRREIEKFQK